MKKRSKGLPVLVVMAGRQYEGMPVALKELEAEIQAKIITHVVIVLPPGTTVVDGDNV